MTLWLLITLALASLNAWAVAQRHKRLEYFTKPATLATLLLGYGLVIPIWSPLTGWFGLGLACGLLGDIFLLLPSRFFIAGLLAFLLGHLAYIIAFLSEGLPTQWWAWLWIAPLGALMWGLGRRVLAGARAAGHSALRGPIAAYILVLAWMTLAGSLSLARPAWPVPAALLATGGAWLFLLSDALLSWNRFVRPWPRGPLWVILTYHLAQICLTLSVIRRFL